MNNQSNLQFGNLQNEANQIEYAIAQYLLNNVNTIQPCKIIKVNENSYDVEILTNYLMADNKPITPLPIYEISKMMVMGGIAGIITELEENDKVLVGFCQRDISIVKKQWDNQNPGSLRMFDLRDGIILGVLSNKLPSIYVKITNKGIELNGPKVTIISDNDTIVKAKNVTVDASKINLGNGGSGVLNGDTKFQVTGVQKGGDTLPVTIVSGISNTVIAQS